MVISHSLDWFWTGFKLSFATGTAVIQSSHWQETQEHSSFKQMNTSSLLLSSFISSPFLQGPKRACLYARSPSYSVYVRGRGVGLWNGLEKNVMQCVLYWSNLAVPSGLQLPVGRFQNTEFSFNNGENLPDWKRNGSASVLQLPNTVYKKSRVIYSICFRKKQNWSLTWDIRQKNCKFYLQVYYVI